MARREDISVTSECALKERNLQAGIGNLLDHYLKVGSSDRIFLAFDPASRRVAGEIEHALTARFLSFTAYQTEYDGRMMPTSLRELFLDDVHNVGILLFRCSIWHQPERKKAKYELGKRLVTLPPCPRVLESPMAQVDPGVMHLLYQDLEAVFQRFQRKGVIEQYLTVQGEGGTGLQAKISHVSYEHGDYSQPKSGGNFPAGEISFGLMEGSVNGYVVIDEKVKGLPPITPQGKIIRLVQNDRLVSGLHPVVFEKILGRDSRLSNVTEISFGICPVSETFESPDVITEEKCLGTAHVGLGANTSFDGNREGSHIDLVFRGATVRIGSPVNPLAGNGLTILENGKLNPRYLSPKTRQFYENYLIY